MISKYIIIIFNENSDILGLCCHDSFQSQYACFIVKLLLF